MTKFEAGKIYLDFTGQAVEIVKVNEKNIWYRYCDFYGNPNEKNPIWRAKLHRESMIGRYEYATVKGGVKVPRGSHNMYSDHPITLEWRLYRETTSFVYEI